MIPLLISLAIIALATFLLARYSYRNPSTAADHEATTSTDCATCGILPSLCHNECEEEEAKEEIIYFDDEELDTFRGKPSDQYSDEETEIFAEVLHTMHPEEVPQWLLSLQSRGIFPPDKLKDELVFFLSN